MSEYVQTRKGDILKYVAGDVRIMCAGWKLCQMGIRDKG